ncbi:alpha/beta fold hydrolase [Nocardioides sp.]|uniref:alpha/beta fold hydrolase n=1 Tax=Nocardioides sp. TaxID=35761 RepID=UPI002B26F9DD|nr:alpha/beta fold hydrolase [Nocardioides sp.]
MSSLSVPGAVIDFDLRGQDATGPAVVQLHGLTSSRARDRTLGLDLGRGLAMDGTRDGAPRVLRYDARGHGLSSGRLVADDYRWDRLADDLLLLLDHVFPGESVHGVGPSMGTGTLLHAATVAPARFDGLTLVVPPTAWETRRQQASTYEAGARLIEDHGIAAFVALGDAALPPPAAAGAPRTVPDVAEALLPTVLRGAATADFPERAAIAALSVPTLVLAWTDDPSHPLSTAEELHALLPCSELVVAATSDEIEEWPELLAAHVTPGAS